MRINFASILALSLSACAIPAGEGRSLHLGLTWVEQDVLGSEIRPDDESHPRHGAELRRTATLGAWIAHPAAGTGVGFQDSKQIAMSDACRVVVLVDDPNDARAILEILNAEGDDICVQS